MSRRYVKVVKTVSERTRKWLGEEAAKEVLNVYSCFVYIIWCKKDNRIYWESLTDVTNKLVTP